MSVTPESRFLELALAGESPTGAVEARVVGELYEAHLGSSRRSTGAFYTPEPLVEHLVSATLDPVLARARTAADVLALRVLDPACGVGYFLLAARDRLRRRLFDFGVDEDPSGCLIGVDLDPVAARLAQGLIPGATILVANALTSRVLAEGAVDVVVGNPPFLNRLRRATSVQAAEAAQLKDRGSSAYTDVSALFLMSALDWVREGGRIGLVQPVSLLAARDAGPVRARCASHAALVSLWAATGHLFDAQVHTCAVVLEVGADQGCVDLVSGDEPSHAGVWRGPLPPAWGPLLARIQGVPEVAVAPASGVLGDLAACTADFRDQYYGLVGHVVEYVGRGVPLITAGLIDPAESRWGSSATRFAKQRYAAPAVDVDALPEPMRRWAQARLVPKVLVASQGRVIEAVADPQGRLLPSVPVLSVIPNRIQDLWRVLAVLLSPVASAMGASTYAGTALHPAAIKLSARQVAALPLPGDQDAWNRAADLVRRAQLEADQQALIAAGEAMCVAYGVDEACLLWWKARLPGAVVGAP